MNSDNQQVNYCEDGEYRVYCEVCDKLCIERFYKSHLKSGAHLNNIREKKIINFYLYFDGTKTMIKKPTKAYIGSLYNENEQF